jgi:hypothetical protein
VSKEAHEMAMKALEKQDVPWAVNSAEEATKRQLLYRSQTVPGGDAIAWGFGGLEPGTEGAVYVRFKAFLSGASEVHGQWQPFRMEPVPTPAGQGATQGQVRLRPVMIGVPVESPPAGWTPNGFHEVRMPSSAVGPDGTIWLRFVNTNPASTVIFDVTHPVEVMQKEEGFAPNYYRSLAIVMIHVSLLAALGVMAGSLFSFPVASLVAVCLFIGGVIGPWFTQQFVKPDIYVRLTTSTVHLDQAWRTFAGAIMTLMPNFGSYSPLDDLVNGRAVGLGRVAVAGAVLFCIKGGLALLVGMYFYSRRELAKTIV